MAIQPMVHINIHIPAAMLKEIQREAKVKGMSVSHIGRKALAIYLHGEYNRRPR